MSLFDWFGLLMICVLGAISPGPSLFIVTKHALVSGRLQGVLVAWSHAFGVGIYALLSILGLNWLTLSYPNLYLGVTYTGGLYLAWLGLSALFQKSSNLVASSQGKPVSWMTAIRDGGLTSLLNPKLLVFFTALFSQFLHFSDSEHGVLLLLATPIIVDGLWYTLVTCLLSSAWILPSLRQYQDVIQRVSGFVLFAFAVRVFAGI